MFYQQKKHYSLSLFRVCHSCGHVNESQRELERCQKCRKSFLPLEYFNKVGDTPTYDISDLYSFVEDINDLALIRGLYVIWDND